MERTVFAMKNPGLNRGSRENIEQVSLSRTTRPFTTRRWRKCAPERGPAEPGRRPPSVPVPGRTTGTRAGWAEGQKTIVKGKRASLSYTHGSGSSHSSTKARVSNHRRGSHRSATTYFPNGLHVTRHGAETESEPCWCLLVLFTVCWPRQQPRNFKLVKVRLDTNACRQ